MTDLAEAVRVRVRETRKNKLFDDATLDAMRLADEFEDVTPEEYVLPLDAMAGFKVIPDKT